MAVPREHGRRERVQHVRRERRGGDRDEDPLERRAVVAKSRADRARVDEIAVPLAQRKQEREQKAQGDDPRRQRHARADAAGDDAQHEAERDRERAEIARRA